MSTQGDLHAALLTGAGITGDAASICAFNDAWNRYLDTLGIDDGALNGRILSFLQLAAADSGTTLNGVQQAFALAQGFEDWEGVTGLGSIESFIIDEDADGFFMMDDTDNIDLS